MASPRVDLSEHDFQDQVIDLAHFLGWKVHHDRPARTQRTGKWITHVQGDAGFPDLVLAKNGRVIFAELKSEKGKISEDQYRWLAELSGWEDWRDGMTTAESNIMSVYVWRPSDLEEIARVLGESR